MKMTRFHLAVMAAIAAWVAAMLSNGPHWITVPKVAAPAIMFFAVIGASTFHFVAANPMYKRKNEHWAIDGWWHRASLIIFGLAGMLLAVGIASRYLNRYCQIVVAVDAVIIVCYAAWLSRYWLTKNLLIAVVCVSPIILGWLAGHRTHPSMPYAILVAFFAYLAREIVKDVEDRYINHGRRITLPLWLGVEPARHIAGTVMLVADALLVVSGPRLQEHTWYVLLTYLVVLHVFLSVTHSLLFRPVGREHDEIKAILLGSGWLMLTFFLQIV
ncbi:MAG: UbiA family prenyltransferase [Patescibacteria group bacterium]|jgi:4-hydroxybenzoate polyprenyltransferase